jgi:DNA-directed RNA polymerase subunit N (RpoN/RPB10)
MIIPIRCVTCNSVIAGKWEAYLKLTKHYRNKLGQPEEMVYLTATTTKTAEGNALDELNVKKICCRRHFLAHVDML